MKFISAITRTTAMVATASLFHSTAAVQPSSYASAFAVAPSGAPVVDNTFEIAHFGPAGCLSTWKNQASHCVIRTECKHQSLVNYNIRLLCIDRANETVRHEFGKGSFDDEETFDTLVVCDQCIADDALQQAAPGVAPAPAPGMEIPTGTYSSFATNSQVAQLSATVQTLSTEVKELKVSMGLNIASVRKLETAVFGAGGLQGASKSPTVAIPVQVQAGSSGAAEQPTSTIAPTQVRALGSGVTALPPAPATGAPMQALTHWGNSNPAVSSSAGQRNVLRKKHFVKQQQQQQQQQQKQQQNELEETSPLIDEAQKPTQQQLDAEEDRVQADDRAIARSAGSFTVAQDSSAMSGDSQMENNDQAAQSAEDDAGLGAFVMDNTDQRAEDEEEPEDGVDGVASSREYVDDDQQ